MAGAAAPRDSGGTAAEEAVPVPQVLCDVRALAARDGAPAGALWKLAESGRQLDANLVHLPAHERVETHTEPDLDVMLLVVAGSGELRSPNGAGAAERAGGATEAFGAAHALVEGTLMWLPHGSTRSIGAGAQGLSYLTVHRRRPGMQIRLHPDSARG
jgi:hypothetical protein